MPKFQPRYEDYTLRDVLATRQALSEHDTEINITSDEPIRCSAPLCRRDIKADESWIIVNAGGKVVVWHMACLHINQKGAFDDADYRGHIASRLRNAGLFGG